MDAENYGELLYDYRKSVVERKHKSNWIDWTKWDSWGSLYKTLAYERSCSRDVDT